MPGTKQTQDMARVWIKLYIGEEDENPAVFGICDFSGIIDDLKEKIKERATNALKAIDADRLEVYAPGTIVPVQGGNRPIDPGDDISSTTTSKTPLIVVAPATSSVSFVNDKSVQ